MFCLLDDLTRDDEEAGKIDSRGQLPSTVRSSAVSLASWPVLPDKRVSWVVSDVGGFAPESGRRSARPLAPGQTDQVAFVFGDSILRSQPFLVTDVN